LACFRCDYQTAAQPGPDSTRLILYAHYVIHYEAELAAAHIDEETQACRLCQKAGSRKKRLMMLRHLALQHNLLEPLLPANHRLPPAASRSSSGAQPLRGLLAVKPPPPNQLAAAAEGGGVLLTCPLCHLALHRNLPVARHRAYLYQHFVVHYKTELTAYTDGGSGCLLCGTEVRPERRLLRHVGLTHGILDQLLPPEVLDVTAALPVHDDGTPGVSGGKTERQNGAAANSGLQVKEEEEGEEMKMVFTDHALVRMAVKV
jgi:hypothetical protein